MPGSIGLPRLLLLVLANLSAASAASGSSERAFRAQDVETYARGVHLPGRRRRFS
jgi:hypothetical protein